MRKLLLAAGAVLLAGVLFHEPLSTHAQVWLLLSQQLPQSPVKPLHTLTTIPTHEVVRFEGRQGTIVADLFAPLVGEGRPALMLALGIPLRLEDRRYILDFADTLARLGYVVLWPRGSALDAVEWKLEEPSTFAASFQYLEQLPTVDSRRISFFGISVGASIALVGATDPQIANRVRALIAFGAYYDLDEYLTSLVTRTTSIDGISAPWEPSDDALDQARRVFAGAGQPEAVELLSAPPAAATLDHFRSLSDAQVSALTRFNPADHIRAFHARTFILHDQGDQYVPYGESLKLRNALRDEQVGAFLLSNLFQHARVKEGIGVDTLRDVLRLYGFAAAALGSL